MKRRRLIWHVFPSYLLITVMAVFAVSVYSYVALRDFYLDETASALEARAHLLSERVRPLVTSDARDELSRLAERLGIRISTRITVISPDGTVLADSDEDASAMDNHADRPEITAALSGGTGVSHRYSYTLEKDMMYVAVPVEVDGVISSVVRTSVPLTAIADQLGAVRGRILIAALLLLGVAALVSYAVSERIARPLREMERGALRFARGEFRHSISVPRSAELASLAESMNRMAADLDGRIRTVLQQKAEQEAVFSSMIEGVVATDREANVITMNSAAADMLGVDRPSMRGRSIHELVRSTSFHEAVGAVLSGDASRVEEVSLAGADGRALEANAAQMLGESGESMGSVVVLNDVTRLRRLERVRRDFVANVSHELRTPVTSIKGFVETLRDELSDDGGNAARFAGIIIKHVDRLNAIIEDLLYLSRVEEDGSEGLVEDTVLLAEVLSGAVEKCRATAEERGVSLELTAEPGIELKLNRQLFEHAVVNLLDNAIKYSSKRGRVEISASRDGHDTLVTVRDFGTGIPEEHRTRIFERFYQVDKSRSRELGGTGLGLSIAKHIVQSHGGTISVESRLNQGSTFSIRLPGAV